MKKLFLVVTFALITLTMSAQENSKFMVKAGIGLSNLVGSQTHGDKARVAYKIGASYDFALSEKFSIIPGLEFSSHNFKEDGIDGTINMSYLQLPIFAAYKFPISESMKLAIKVGPYVSYGLFGSDIEFYNTRRTKKNVFDSDMFDRFDVGGIAGLSLELEQFMVGFEFSRGFKKLNSNVKAFNQVYGLVIGYKF